MSKKTSYLLGILFTIIIGTLLYCYLCDDCNCFPDKNANETETNAIVEPDVKEATLTPFAVKDGNGALNFNINDNFNFNSSGFKILDSVSTNVDNGVLKIKEYLDANGQKRLKITGYYTSNEDNNSAYPNLGLARANAVKNYFTSKGISSRLIDTFGELKDDLTPDANNIYYGPVAYDIATLEEGDNSDEEAMKALGEQIKANPLVLYFNTGEAAISLTAEQRQKMANISRYLDKVEGATCNVTGHTDNTGDASNNLALGQERADFAKRYLIRNAIPESKISAISKGQTEPIADNGTEEGRAKNRRTIVTIN